MKDKDKIKNAVQHIFDDYKSILNYFMVWKNNDLDYSCIMSIMPFFCMYVAEGFDFLVKYQIINNDCISSGNLKNIKKCRALGVKLYSPFKEETFNSINDFNREEYMKFFKKAFPDSNPELLKIVDNYFLCVVDGTPVGNYHLYSKKILNMEIGSYIDDVSSRVYNHSYLLGSFTTAIVRALDPKFDENVLGNKRIDIKANYIDLNMAYNYSNFSIENCPPILMAMLDVLCVVNSIRKYFCLINDDKIFGIKVVYCVLFHSILSIKSIISYCQINKISIPITDSLMLCVEKWEDKYIKNKLRKYCMHYDFPDNEWENDPFTKEFEKFFNFSIDEIYDDLKKEADIIGNILQEYLIKKDIVFI